MDDDEVAASDDITQRITTGSEQVTVLRGIDCAFFEPVG